MDSMSSRYVSSISNTKELSQSLRDLEKELGNHRSVIDKNSRELAKVNAEVEAQKLKEIKKLQEKIRNLETQTNWVKNEEPALKINQEHMLKKLDIL